MAHYIPGRMPLPFAEVPQANSFAIRYIFDDIVRPSIYKANNQLCINIERPGCWMDVFQDETTAEAYKESLDIWDGLMDGDGKFTASGFQVANRIVEPERTDPTLEEYIAKKYQIDEEYSLAITSRAMWDLLMIRGFPTYDRSEELL